MTLKPGQHIHIIACPRGEVGGPRLPPVVRPSEGVLRRVAGRRTRPKEKTRLPLRMTVYGVRWAARPDLGFPPKGFSVFRVAGSKRTKIGDFFLPRSKTWGVFRADAEARRPVMGPYFPTITRDNLGYLLPIVRLADPRTPISELRLLALKVADFFGEPHRADPGLAWSFWATGEAPPLTSLLSSTATRAALIAYYRSRATTYLLALALRFEYAVLFGLATDDLVPSATTNVHHLVAAKWAKDSGGSSTQLDRKKTCIPPPPREVEATRVPGSVGHPAFVAWPGWAHPAALSPTDVGGEPLPPTALVPRVPSPHTALTWSEAEPSGRLIDYGPVLYLASRFHFGADSAKELSSPPLPSGAVFEPLFEGEPLIRPSEPPHAIDTPGMPWPPLEGHYVYEVKSLNLLGFVSTTGTRARVRHHDDLAPLPPRVRVPDGPTLTVDGAGNAVTTLALDWDSAEDFVSPDAVEFRVAASFSALSTVAVEVLELLSADPLVCTIQVASVAAPADEYSGLRLMLPNGEFVIVEHGAGAPATMKVRRCGGRAPAVGVTGIILAPQPPTPPVRVAKEARAAASTAVVEAVTSLSPVEVRLAPYAPVNTARLYLHLLRATFDAHRVGDRFRLTAPVEGAPGAEAWAKWLALADPAVAMNGSPVIVYPPHLLTVTTPVPSGFVAGGLSLQVTSADDADYVASPALPGTSPALLDLRGNESSYAEVLLSLRSSAPPPEPGVGVFDPGSRLWASSAANYAEKAQFEVQWSAVAGAVRYEVWRALEGSLEDAAAEASDTKLRALAATQPAAFELRTGSAFGTRYLDELPGRAPTRALYRVRAISAAGVAGSFSPLLGPVHVPDVRPPPAPNLLRVAAAPVAEADRALVIEWTQPALAADLRFEIEARQAGVGDARFEPVTSIPAGTPPTGGRFRFVHADQVPGRKVEYRVIAVREALDPIDPAGNTRRDIRSAPSAARVGVAISAAPLAAPAGLAGVHDAGAGAVRLSWSNDDTYQSIAVYRRAPSRFGFELLTELPGSAELHDDAAATPGTWAYQLRARGHMREARTEAVEVLVP